MSLNHKPRTFFFFIVGFLPLVVYVHTLAPTITWRNDGVDSGDLATAIAVGGVPHPPGYPTYLILGEAFKLVPVGDIAYRLNLLSATCAALTVAVVGLVIHQTLSKAIGPRLQGQEGIHRAQRLIWLCAASASLVLAFSGPFWSQAVITEVYTLNVLFVAILLYGALRVQPVNERWLGPGLFGSLGLSLGNHPSVILVLPMLIWLLKGRWHRQMTVAAFLAFCIGLSVYLVIPIRAATAAPVNWGMAKTWSNFLWLVSATPYRQFLFAIPWGFVPSRILAEIRFLAGAFMWWGLPIGLLGLRKLLHLNRALVHGSLVTFILFSIYSIGYNTADSYVYLLPALLIFSVWIGWGLYDLGNALQTWFAPGARRSYLVGWSIILLPLVSLWSNFSDQNISRDYQAYAYAHQSLHTVAPGAVIITDDDPRTFALWYGRYGLALRPDVAIVNSNLLAYTWYRYTLQQTHANLVLSNQVDQPVTTLSAFIELNVSNSSIYLATLKTPTLRGIRLEPSGHLQRVVRSSYYRNHSRITLPVPYRKD